jgi:hypothetical protein
MLWQYGMTPSNQGQRAPGPGVMPWHSFTAVPTVKALQNDSSVFEGHIIYMNFPPTIYEKGSYTYSLRVGGVIHHPQ